MGLAILGVGFVAGCAGSVLDTPQENPLPTTTPIVELEPATTAPTTIATQVYVVADGDTLGAIADRFGTTVDELVGLNGLTDADTLAVGDELLIPATETDVGPGSEG